MSQPTFLARLEKISVWQSGGRRAPHKPLLMLYALGRVQQRKERLVAYREIESELGPLLRRFGAPRKTIHPEFPFGRLPNDGLWEVPDIEKVSRTQSGDLHVSSMVELGIQGGLKKEDYETLAEDPRLLLESASMLLNAHFPSSLHEEIRSAVGLSDVWEYWDVVALKNGLLPKRDPKFRKEILEAYEYRCAVCQYDIHLGDEPLGLEAAHVKWLAAGGPNKVQNGLALCGFHHKAFDRGAWGLEKHRQQYRILVSNEVRSQTEALRWLEDYRGAVLQTPQRAESAPDANFVQWHSDEVFRSPAKNT